MKPTNQNIERQHANASMGTRPTPIVHWREGAGEALMRVRRGFFFPSPRQRHAPRQPTLARVPVDLARVDLLAHSVGP
jgi:hypothetical protein